MQHILPISFHAASSYFPLKEYNKEILIPVIPIIGTIYLFKKHVYRLSPENLVTISEEKYRKSFKILKVCGVGNLLTSAIILAFYNPYTSVAALMASNLCFSVILLPSLFGLGVGTFLLGKFIDEPIYERFKKNPEAFINNYDEKDRKGLLEKYNKNKDRLFLISLEESHKNLVTLAISLKNKLRSQEFWEKNNIPKEEGRAFWKNSEIVKEVSVFMEAAYKEMELFYTELEKKGGGDIRTMALAMVDQDAKPNFCFPFFYNSITDIYHLARGCAYPYGNSTLINSRLTDEDQKPYFTEGTPQYTWRELYNQFCEKFTLLCLEAAKVEMGDFRDERFRDWSRPDYPKEGGSYPTSYEFHMSRPTP